MPNHGWETVSRALPSAGLLSAPFPLEALFSSVGFNGNLCHSAAFDVPCRFQTETDFVLRIIFILQMVCRRFDGNVMSETL